MYAHVNSTKTSLDVLPLRSTHYLVFLTLVLGGLQLTWSVVLGYGTPYLFSLGLTKHGTSLVWMAGPLTGIIMQPLIGFFSDRSRAVIGRRRPFMVVGVVGVVLCLMGLAHFKGMASFFLKRHPRVERAVVIIVSVIMIYLLDFSINIVQASSRALIIDMVPAEQQDAANAWASRMIGIFNVVGYMNGYLDLPKIAPIFGNTEFKALSFISSIVLILCTCITFFTAKENRYVVQREHTFKNTTWTSEFISFFKTMFSTVLSLPSGIFWVCIVQFFAWIDIKKGTTYIAEIYAENHCTRYFNSLNRLIDSKDIYSQIEEVTRYGSFAFMLFSIISLFGTLLFPMIASSEKKIVKYILGIKYFSFIDKLNIPSLWTMSHFLFSLCMLLTIFAHKVSYATTIVALCGLSWSITLWAPFSLISTELSLKNEFHRSGTILGLHNIFISAPQVLSIIIAGIIFKFTGYKKFEDIVSCKSKMDYSLVWVFQISGIAALIAMYLSFKISSEYICIRD
ncbi:hypothetical protein PMAC_000433 [Pneumocystis sp. 'macacae']|nr:hypothetical protein PMAC_000433 [Pneumocystis sp. 'macacae']